MSLFKNKKKWNSFKMFLYIVPFLLLSLLFSYYPLYGWIYAFFDYKPPRPFSWDDFVGLKWFASLVENEIKINQLIQVIKLSLIHISVFHTWHAGGNHVIL